MKKINKHLLLTVLAVIIAASLAADASEHELWQKAKEIALKNKYWIPGELVQTALQKNSKGKVKSEESIIIEYRSSGTSIEAEYVSGLRDGEAIALDDERLQDVLSEDMLDDSSLFYNFEGKDLRIVLSNQYKDIDGLICRGFDYSFSRQTSEGMDLQSSGTVWIDTLSGVPVLNQMQVESPKKVVKNMTFSYHYNPDPKAWYIDEVEMSFQLALVILKYNMEIKRTYSRFWLYEPK